MGTLRFLLALWVACQHGGFPIFHAILPTSTAAVMVFFAISGFLMAMVLARNDLSIGAFYLSRFLRIFPLYWMVLGLTVLSGLFGLVDLSHGFGFSPLDSILTYWPTATTFAKVEILFANVATVSQDILREIFYDIESGQFTTVRTPTTIGGLSFNLVGQAWSLGPEVLFYVAAPFIVTRVYVVAATLAVCAVARTMTGPVGQVYDLVFVYMPFFLTGSAMYHAMKAPRVLALLTAALGGWLIYETMRAFLPLSGILIVLVLPLSLPILVQRRPRFDRFLGDMSYPIYVSHFLIMQFCVFYAPPEWLIPITAASYGVAAVALTFYLERPIAWFRHTVSRVAT